MKRVPCQKLENLPTNLILKCFPSDVPGVDCQVEGDPNYPDYVNCKELSQSQKVGNYMYLENVSHLYTRIRGDYLQIITFTHVISVALLYRLIVF